MSENIPADPRPIAGRTGLWHSFSARDADGLAAWLRAVGFVEHASYRDDAGLVVHAEWVWPQGGGVMFGSDRPDGGVHNTGTASAYLVHPDPDAVVAAALAAGGTVVREVVDQDYGGRGGTVSDPEGNQWSIGSYQPGEPG